MLELNLSSNLKYLDYIFYALKEYEYIDDEKNETTEERHVRLDSVFKNEVKTKYNECIITGKPAWQCQVAHILPFKYSNDDEKYDPNNGLLLSIDIHFYFDSQSTDFKTFDLSINPNSGEISLSDRIMNDKTMSYYHQFNGKKININKENMKYLEKKYKLYNNHKLNK